MPAQSQYGYNQGFQTSPFGDLVLGADGNIWAWTSTSSVGPPHYVELSSTSVNYHSLLTNPYGPLDNVTPAPCNVNGTC